MIALVICSASTAQDSIFPLGEKAPNINHTGNVWLKELVKADPVLDVHISVATFDAGAKLNWHKHPGGQILLITDGIGYYQEKGRPKQILRKGDVVRCLPNIAHWHGASPEAGVTYLAVNANNEKGKTVWLEKVTDKEYLDGGSPVGRELTEEEEIIVLSKKMWKWMAEKNTDSLAALFDEQSAFVHIDGSWGKEREINTIKTGGIWYKKADIHDVSVNIIGNTAILLNSISLVAEVAGKEVSNLFIVTEVYTRGNGQWRLASLSFTRTLRPADIRN